MASLIERMLKNSTVDDASTITNSAFYNKEEEYITTDVPIMNLALSGKLDGGLSAGITQFAGESKTYKSGYIAELMLAHLNSHPEAIVLFLDSEGGLPMSYLISRGMDISRIVHIPVTNVEECKIELVSQLNGFTRDDKVLIAIDSVGNLASKKELDDADNGKIVADMSRAKALNSLWRTITSQLVFKKIPLVFVGSYYMSQDMYPKVVLAGGKKGELNCNTIILIKRRPIREGKDVVGWTFRLIIHKSRIIKEGIELGVDITYENGIDYTSGLYDFAVGCGKIKKAGSWIYVRDEMTGEYSSNIRTSDLNRSFYEDLLSKDYFKKYVQDEVSLVKTEE